MKSCTRYFDPFLNSLKRHPDKTVLVGKRDGQWTGYNRRELMDRAVGLSCGLMDRGGLRPGDKVITVSGNRPEVFLVDIAVTQVGGIHVPIVPNYNEEDLRYILEQCRPRFIFASGMLAIDQCSRIVDALELDTHVISIVPHERAEDIESFIRPTDAEDRDRIEVLRDGIGPEDVYSIYYTSGTGGGPKGAVYHHGAIGMIDYIIECIDATTDTVSLSYLPISHAYERHHILAVVNAGGTVYFAESTASVVGNLQEVRPTFMTSVPILLEHIVANIEDTVAGLPEGQRERVAELLGKAKEFEPDGRPSQIADTKSATAWRALLGGRLDCMTSAGAPLPPPINRFFHAVGIPVLECYGLTECGIGTYSTLPDGIRPGSVGRAARGIEFAVHPDDGEILIRSPFTTREIFGIPELTDRLLEENGYLRTGDIGEIDDDGFIYVRGRKSELFKLPNGRFFAPSRVEDRLKTSPLIDNALVHWRNDRIEAVLSPAADLRGDEDDQLIDRLRDEVDRLHNDHVIEMERIGSIRIDRSDWSIDNGKLTPTMKVRRHKIIESMDV